MSTILESGMEYQAYLDVFGIKFQTFFLVHQEFLDIFALITLKLNHLTHLRIVDDGAIASYVTQTVSNG